MTPVMGVPSVKGTPFRAAIGRAAVVLAVTAIMGGIAALPARADNDDNRGHGRGNPHEYRGNPHERRGDERDHDEWNQREWRGQHPHVNVAPDYYVYAPPPVVYAPPPVPPSLNFVFPLDLR